MFIFWFFLAACGKTRFEAFYKGTGLTLVGRGLKQKL